MKKSLIALAVAGMFVASAASAQSSNVTLYGRINLDLQFTSSASDDGLAEQHALNSNASRIGVRGSEDLGGGLSAIFQIESSFAGDVGGGTLAGRDTYLGLAGSWGQVRFGYMLTPMDQLHGIWGNAPTFTTSILNTEALWTQNPHSGGAWGQFAQRWGNSIRYDSPNMNGLKISAHLIPLDEGPDDNMSVAFSASVIYDNAGLQIGGGVEYATYDDNIGDGSDLNLTLTAGYDFGFIRPAAVVEYIKVTDIATVGKGDTDRLLFGASVTAPVGAGKIYGALVYADEWKDVDDSSAWQAEISYTYALSKRTSLYAGFVYIANDDGANYTFATNGNKGNANGNNQSGLIFGMMHNF